LAGLVTDRGAVGPDDVIEVCRAVSVAFNQPALSQLLASNPI
jgi:hypothetical protein